ncbi:MAG: sterol desaturase family protein [Gammaproteobacteria bacterium]
MNACWSAGLSLDAVRDCAARATGAPRLFLDQTSPFYWPFLAAFLAIAALVYLLSRRRPAGWSSRDGLRFVFPAGIWKHGSTRIDLIVFALNLTFIPIATLSVALVSAPSVDAALLRYLGVPPLQLPTGIVGACIQFSIIALVTGFAEYFQHYLLHRIPALWAIHRAHHSAEVLNLFTQFRMHPLEVAFAALTVGSAGGLALGLALYLGSGDLNQSAVWLWGTLIIGKNLVQNFRHSHIWISYGRFFDRLFISPSMHQIHHSIRPEHLGRNLGQILTVWDYLFGTLYVPRSKEELEFGVSPSERGPDNPHESVRGFYIEPLLESWRAARRPTASYARGRDGQPDQAETRGAEPAETSALQKRST